MRVEPRLSPTSRRPIGAVHSPWTSASRVLWHTVCYKSTIIIIINFLKWSGSLTTTQAVLDLRHSFGALAKPADCLFITPLHSQPVCLQMCFLDIFCDLQPFGCNSRGRLLDPPVWSVKRVVASPIREPAHAFLLVPHWHINGISLTVLKLFSWLQKRFRQPARPPPASPTLMRWQLPLLKLLLHRAWKTLTAFGKIIEALQFCCSTKW